MRSAVLLAALSISLAAPMAASPEGDPESPVSRKESRATRPPFENPLLETVVQMTRAEVPTKTILAYLRVRRVLLQSDIETEDLVQLRLEGVAEEVIAYIARQSRVDVPPLPPAPPPEGAQEPEGPPAPGTPPPAANGDQAVPVEPDPGDTGLIMGVYDPVPPDIMPCHQPFPPFDCGPPPVVLWQGGSSSKESTGKKKAKNAQTADTGKRSGAAAPPPKPASPPPAAAAPAPPASAPSAPSAPSSPRSAPAHARR
jgi:hypothetical protein